MAFSKKYHDLSLHQLFGEYLKIQPNSEDLYYPDMFVKDIHKAYLEDNKVNLPSPLYATWDIVEECNLCCLFCSSTAPKTKQVFISNPFAILIAEKIISDNIKYVSIRGGEPSLCKELPSVINRLTNAGVFIEVVTNGTNITQDFFEKISSIQHSLFRIKISLDSADVDINDSQRGKNSHYYAVRAMECCKYNNFQFRVQMVLTNYNYMDICNTYLFCADKGAKSFGCMILLPIGRGKHSKLRISLNKEILLQLIDIIGMKRATVVEKIGLGVDAIKLYKPYVSKLNISYEEAVISGHIKCNGFKTRIYINSQGVVYPCDLLQYDEFRAGSILEFDYWNSIAAESLRRRNRGNINHCKNCEIFGCNMGCMAISIENSEDVNAIVPNCEV